MIGASEIYILIIFLFNTILVIAQPITAIEVVTAGIGLMVKSATWGQYLFS